MVNTEMTTQKKERFETMKKKIVGVDGKISHAAVLQLFHDRMNNGEGREILRRLTGSKNVTSMPNSQNCQKQI